MAGMATNRTWSTRQELLGVLTAPTNLRRSLAIALFIGTVFVAMNQLDPIVSGQATFFVWLKVGLTYLTPLIVSNLGIVSATHRPPKAVRHAPSRHITRKEPHHHAAHQREAHRRRLHA